MKDLRDRVVLITAAGSGIGRASALAYADAGARVHLVDISVNRLDEVAAEITAAGGTVGGVHPLDCTDADAMESLAGEVMATQGRVDILQLGVGIIVAGAFEETSLEQWRRVMDTNLWSAVHGLRAFLPSMLARTRVGKGRDSEGHVVIIASLAGLVAFPYTSAYTATKYALVGLAESLSLELAGSGVSVTAVCPGAVSTNLMRDGELALPGGSETGIRRAVERFAAKPERVAREILRAVRRRKSLILPSAEALPLWLIKRASGGLFDSAARSFTSKIRGFASRR